MKKPEHFVETHIRGLFIGSEGSVRNETGLLGGTCFNTDRVYYYIHHPRGRTMMLVSDLVYVHHVNRGVRMEPLTRVQFKDGNYFNLSAENLYPAPWRQRGRRVSIEGHTNKGRTHEVHVAPLDAAGPRQLRHHPA